MRRSRPLVLTAMAAILAMISLSRSVFWGPMAITMMGWPSGRDDPDAAVPAGALCRVVPGPPAEGGSDNPVAASAGTGGIKSGDRASRFRQSSPRKHQDLEYPWLI